MALKGGSGNGDAPDRILTEPDVATGADGAGAEGLAATIAGLNLVTGEASVEGLNGLEVVANRDPRKVLASFAVTSKA